MTRPPARRSKYGAIPTVVDGVRFASRKEAARWQELQFLQQAGEITDLQRQPRYAIVIRGVQVCAYVADFTYLEGRSRITEDVKGVQTAVYRLKKRLLWATHRIAIRET